MVLHWESVTVLAEPAVPLLEGYVGTDERLVEDNGESQNLVKFLASTHATGSNS